MFSKTKIENILGLGFNALNLSLYLMTMAASVMKAVMEYRDISHILTCIYGFILCSWLIVMETKTFQVNFQYFGLFTLYRGKSIIFLLLGSIIFSTLHVFILVAGIVNLSFGLIYMTISFIPSFPLPKPIIENWQNWQEYSAEGLDLDRPKNNFDNAARLRKSMIEIPQHSKLNPA
ncbi:hypothetical protein BDF21DRAFT_425805 [Thamnidium elegans]|nr:hypothetical protein BDF21DRAFT_425805 [Thamnidium elegans]